MAEPSLEQGSSTLPAAPERSAAGSGARLAAQRVPRPAGRIEGAPHPTTLSSTIRPFVTLTVAALSIAALDLAGCAEGSAKGVSERETLSVLAVGDSILAFNGDESTPTQLAEVLDLRGVEVVVENRVVSGACLASCGDGVEQTIAEQYSGDEWDLVLITGGGNDVGDACAPADGSITADLTGGAMVDLVDEVTGSGAVALVHGYATSLDPALFEGCPSFQVLIDRYRALGEARDEVEFLDVGRTMNPSTPELYADEIHPNADGSRVIAVFIADELAARGLVG